MAVGRAPRTANLGLEATKVQLERGFIRVDEWMQTGEPGIFAIGDVVAGLPQLAHVAAMAGMVVAAKVAGKRARPVRRDRIPACTYCEPQIGSVGLTEAQAKAAGHQVKVGKFPFSANSKASIVGSHEGFVKVVADAKHGEVLGVHIIGPQATEIGRRSGGGHGTGSDHRRADVHHPRSPHLGGGDAGWLWQRGKHGHQCLSRLFSKYGRVPAQSRPPGLRHGAGFAAAAVRLAPAGAYRRRAAAGRTPPGAHPGPECPP